MDLISKNLAHFAREVRAATPDTEGFLNQRRNPEYGIIAHANLGHVLHYYARRATATDPMWSYIGPDNWARSMAFFRATDEPTAIAISVLLNGRYVVTADTDPEETIVGRLHHRDGRSGDHGPRLERFRLITESSPGREGFGMLIDKVVEPEHELDRVAYKLFEVVKGAQLEIEAAANDRVSASLTLEAPSGRHFVYVASGVGGEDGFVHLRVPYSTGSGTPIHATGPYRISVGTRLARVHVNEVDIWEGRHVVVSLDGGAAELF
jgi:hypothetical protein